MPKETQLAGPGPDRRGAGPRPAIITAALIFGLMFPASVLAQGKHGGGAHPPPPAHAEPVEKTPIDDFERMSPEEQQKALDQLPPQQRKKVEERLKKFNQLPPEQRQALKNMYNRLNQLPPERQAKVREAINKFTEQPPARQQAIRDELRSMAALPKPERQARLSSPEFKSKFNGKEQQIVRHMSDLLPPGT